MDIPLGKTTPYVEHYDPTRLAPLERASAWESLGLHGRPPFTGIDVWTAYEFSWLSPHGLPRSVVLRVTVPSESPRIIESKSMKLYLNGFALSRFGGQAEVLDVVRRDLEVGFGAPVAVETLRESDLAPAALPGTSLDDQDLEIDAFEREPGRLRVTADATAEEDLHTHLFRSLCPVTGQPDWASMLIRYRGPPIERASLLRYLVSFRRHQGFHETTVEQIHLDLKRHCRCERLLVAGYFLRRGGIDISPFRADASMEWPVRRVARQ